MITAKAAVGMIWAERKWRRRRSAVEPKISHIKYDNRMDRTYLKGREGDKINALLAGSGANLRKLLVAFSLSLFILTKKIVEFVKSLRSVDAQVQLANNFLT
ncbi:MAG: hypothetical protein H8E14_05950 [Candidatus Marinimicrobia bacterium]|nr:hypothetical protein [Candidatus Neomarinimicrobiota bacterium]